MMDGVLYLSFPPATAFMLYEFYVYLSPHDCPLKRSCVVAMMILERPHYDLPFRYMPMTSARSPLLRRLHLYQSVCVG